MSACHRFPLINISDVGARPDDIFEVAPRLRERLTQDPNALSRLLIHVALAHQPPIFADRSRSGNGNDLTRAYRTAITHDRFPWSAGPNSGVLVGHLTSPLIDINYTSYIIVLIVFFIPKIHSNEADV